MLTYAGNLCFPKKLLSNKQNWLHASFPIWLNFHQTGHHPSTYKFRDQEKSQLLAQQHFYLQTFGAIMQMLDGRQMPDEGKTSVIVPILRG